MLPILYTVAPLVLAVMGSLSLAVCYQVVQYMIFRPLKSRLRGSKLRYAYVVPRLKEAFAPSCSGEDDERAKSCSSGMFEDALETVTVDTVETQSKPSSGGSGPATGSSAAVPAIGP